VSDPFEQILEQSVGGNQATRLSTVQLEQIARGIPGATITSGERSPEHNRAVGGVPNSQHIAGTAMDFVAPGLTLQQVQAFFPGEQVIQHDAGSGMHFHVQGAPGTVAEAAPPPAAPDDPNDPFLAVLKAATSPGHEGLAGLAGAGDRGNSAPDMGVVLGNSGPSADGVRQGPPPGNSGSSGDSGNSGLEPSPGPGAGNGPGPGDVINATPLLFGVSPDDAQNIVAGAQQGLTNVGLTGIRGARWLAQKLTGSDLGISDADAHMAYQVGQDRARGNAQDPNSWAFTGGDMIGGTLPLLPVLEAKPLQALGATGRIAKALSRYGDIALQGGAFGAGTSGGEDVADKAKWGALLAPALTKAGDVALPKAINIAKALRDKLAPAGEDVAPAASDQAASLAQAIREQSGSGAKTIRTGAELENGLTDAGRAIEAEHGGPGKIVTIDGANFREYPDGKRSLIVDIGGGAPSPAAAQRSQVDHPDIGPISIPANVAQSHPDAAGQIAKMQIVPSPEDAARGVAVLEGNGYRATVEQTPGAPEQLRVSSLSKQDGTPGLAEDGLASQVGREGSPVPGEASNIPDQASNSNKALAGAVRVSGKGPFPPEEGLIKQALGSRGAQAGIQSTTDLPPDVTATLGDLMKQGVPIEQALREADIRAIGGKPTIATISRNPEDQQAMWEGAKQPTAEGRALAQQIAGNNEAVHHAIQHQIDVYGGVPAQGSSAESVAISLARASDAVKRNVSRLYEEAERADGDALVPADGIYSVIRDPLKRAAINPKAAGFLKGIEQRLDILTHNGKTGLNAHALEHLRRAANEAYDEIGSPEVRQRIQDVTDAIDDAFEALGDKGPTYAKARAAHAEWAKRYEDPEGVRQIIHRTASGQFVNADNWRKLENGFVAGMADRPFIQLVKQLRENGDNPTIDRLKASVIQRAYERATNSATDKLGNSIVNGKLFMGQLDRIGPAKLQALFDKDEIARLASIGRAATALNEAVPGTVNTSNTSSALLKALSGMNDNQKPKLFGKLSKAAAHLGVAHVAPGVGNLAVEGVSHATGAAREAAQARKVAEGIREMMDPAEARARVKASEEARQLAEKVRKVTSKTAPVAGPLGDRRR